MNDGLLILKGFCYYNGTGVAKDQAEAVKYYRLAADQGHAQAQFNLGRICLNIIPLLHLILILYVTMVC